MWIAYTVSWIFYPELIPPSNHIITESQTDCTGDLVFALAGQRRFITDLPLPARQKRDRKAADQMDRLWDICGGVRYCGNLQPPFSLPALRALGPAMAPLCDGGVCVGHYVSCACPSNDRLLDPALPPVRYRPDHQPHPGLQRFDRIAGFGVFPQRGAAAAGLSGPVAVFHRALHPGDGGAFFPLRRRIQSIIDRRFYRRRYDAERIIAAFAVQIRDQVELEKLSAALLATVEETMQPERASLWMREFVKHLRKIPSRLNSSLAAAARFGPLRRCAGRPRRRGLTGCRRSGSRSGVPPTRNTRSGR